MSKQRQPEYRPVLLKLHRTYSRDEAISFLMDTIKKLEFENGVLKSDIADLEYKLSVKPSVQIVEVEVEVETKQRLKAWKKDDAFKHFTEEAIKDKERLRLANKEIEFWRNKYLVLKNPELHGSLKIPEQV